MYSHLKSLICLPVIQVDTISQKNTDPTKWQSQFIAKLTKAALARCFCVLLISHFRLSGLVVSFNGRRKEAHTDRKEKK